MASAPAAFASSSTPQAIPWHHNHLDKEGSTRRLQPEAKPLLSQVRFLGLQLRCILLLLQGTDSFKQTTVLKLLVFLIESVLCKVPPKDWIKDYDASHACEVLATSLEHLGNVLIYTLG